MKPTPQDLGYHHGRWLNDEVFIGVMHLTFGRGRIVVGDEFSVFNGW